jgi:hypothetical protein
MTIFDKKDGLLGWAIFYSSLSKYTQFDLKSNGKSPKSSRPKSANSMNNCAL